MTRSPTDEPIMMMRPPFFMCFSAACVATSVPRTLTSISRSSSSSVVSSNLLGIAVPALFTSTSGRPKAATVSSTAALLASASAASAWIAIALPPARPISLTTDAAASAPFVYVMAMFAPCAARRLAIAAPMPREPPVMSAIFPSSLFMFIFKVSYVLTDACELQYLVACRLGTKFEQDLSAAIRFQRLLERFLELLERVDMLHCGGERSISHEVAQLLVNILDLC